MRKAAVVVAAVMAVVGSLGLGWLVGMRHKGSIVVAAQRRVNRAVFNPRQLKTAGTAGSAYAVVRHVGRTSGRRFETPVGAEPTEDGFVVALMYGPASDWLKNVMASGSATIVHRGVEHAVDRPTLVPFGTVEHHFADARALRTFGVTQAVRLHARDPDRSGHRSAG